MHDIHTDKKAIRSISDEELSDLRADVLGLGIIRVLIFYNKLDI